jgi:uncharacterized membrane protein
VQCGILFLEWSGVAVLLTTAAKSLYTWARKKSRVQLDLAQGIALALEFKLGGEVLRTVIVREQSELMILGVIILLRGALTFLIHWEIKGEESRIHDELLLHAQDTDPTSPKHKTKDA